MRFGVGVIRIQNDAVDPLVIEAVVGFTLGNPGIFDVAEQDLPRDVIELVVSQNVILGAPEAREDALHLVQVRKRILVLRERIDQIPQLDDEVDLLPVHGLDEVFRLFQGRRVLSRGCIRLVGVVDVRNHPETGDVSGAGHAGPEKQQQHYLQSLFHDFSPCCWCMTIV